MGQISRVHVDVSLASPHVSLDHLPMTSLITNDGALFYLILQQKLTASPHFLSSFICQRSDGALVCLTLQQKPEARAYYDLAVVTLKFVFPAPKALDGILRRDMPIVRLKGVEFTYDGAERPQLEDVNVQCNMESRVAVLGANGAGKSTLIKILTGQFQAQVSGHKLAAGFQKGDSCGGFSRI